MINKTPANQAYVGNSTVIELASLCFEEDLDRDFVLKELSCCGGEPHMAKGTDAELLKAALVGYQVQWERLGQTIADIKSQLGQRGSGQRPKPEESGSEEPAPRRRGMSAAGKARIAAAQRKRWASLKAAASVKASKSEPVKPKRKRKLSAAGRARIIAATKARWAAFRRAKAQKPVSKKGR
jgi:hypothetical protein